MILEIICSIVFPPVLYFLYTYVHHLMQMKNYPPGPFPLPIIGNVVKNPAFKSFSELTKKYGDVFSVSLGMNRVVVVNSIELANEALITKAEQFSARPGPTYSVGRMMDGSKTMTFCDSVILFKYLKRLQKQALEMFSDTKGKMERIAIEESEDLNKRIKAREGEITDVRYEFGKYRVPLLVLYHIKFSVLFDNTPLYLKTVTLLCTAFAFTVSVLHIMYKSSNSFHFIWTLYEM